MWPAPDDTQRDFALALLDPDRAAPAQLAGTRLRIRCGLDVHRTNFRVNLVDALRSTFPVTAALVGAEFFNAMAVEFVQASPPRSPVLIEYGQELAGFIDGFEPAAGVPYLGDVTRLEWAWLEAYHAAEGLAAGAADLLGVNADALAAATLCLHPSVRLVRSAFPIASIWAAHQSQQGGMPQTCAGETALIVRPEAEVRVFALAGIQASFVSALIAGSTIEQSAATVQASEPDFDAGAALLELLGCGAIAAFRH